MIGIDEAQFFSDSLVEICNRLANKGKRVIVTGLDMIFEANLLARCESITAAEFVCKLHAVCNQTGKWQITQIESQKIKEK